MAKEGLVNLTGDIRIKLSSSALHAASYSLLYALMTRAGLAIRLKG